jgi:hypothetical protein
VVRLVILHKEIMVVVAQQIQLINLLLVVEVVLVVLVVLEFTTILGQAVLEVQHLHQQLQAHQ